MAKQNNYSDDEMGAAGFRLNVLSQLKETRAGVDDLKSSFGESEVVMNKISNSLDLISASLSAFAKNSYYLAVGMMIILLATVTFSGSIALAVLQTGFRADRTGIQLIPKQTTSEVRNEAK